MANLRKIIMIQEFLKNGSNEDNPEIERTMRFLEKYCSQENSTKRQYNFIIDYLKHNYSNLPPQILAQIYSLVPEPKNMDPASREKRFRPSGVEEVDSPVDTFREPDYPIVINTSFKLARKLCLSEQRKGKTLAQLCMRYIKKNEKMLHSYYTEKIGRVAKFVQENPNLGEFGDLVEEIVRDNNYKMVMISHIKICN